MSLITSIRAASAVILALSISVLAATPPHTQAQIGLPGTWGTNACEPLSGGPRARRQMRFTAREFSRTWTRFADGACSTPTVRVRTEGTWRATGPSPSVPGAIELELKPVTVFLTPLTTTAADMLNATPYACGTGAWSVGAEQEVLATSGCAVVQISPYRGLTEFDIALVQGTKLFVGAPPIDGGQPNLPQRRPTTLSGPLDLIQAVPAEILLPATGADMTTQRARR